MRARPWYVGGPEVPGPGTQVPGGDAQAVSQLIAVSLSNLILLVGRVSVPGGGQACALRYLTLDGSDYPSHATQEAAIAGYIRWANRRATPKRHFAVNSKIRRPDYLPNVA